MPKLDQQAGPAVEFGCCRFHGFYAEEVARPLQLFCESLTIWSQSKGPSPFVAFEPPGEQEVVFLLHVKCKESEAPDRWQTFRSAGWHDIGSIDSQKQSLNIENFHVKV